jgi:hypothetical protein
MGSLRPNGSRHRILALATLGLYLAAFVSALDAGQAPAAAGKTVWDGVFTDAQADRGRTLYAANCAECHGASLEGGEGKTLKGDQFWMDWGQQTVGELVNYVSKNMPASEDGSLAGTLAPSTYIDIVAHILKMNDMPAGALELTATSGTGVQIVKKGGSDELPASTLAHVVGCLEPRGADGNWRLARASRPIRVSTGGKPDTNVPLGDREYALKFVLRNLTSFVGHRVSVVGLLLGAGGVDGINVNTVESVAATCN